MTTSYTYDGLDILREVRGSTTLKYVHGPGATSRWLLKRRGLASYFHADGLGSVVKVTNAAGRRDTHAAVRRMGQP